MANMLGWVLDLGEGGVKFILRFWLTNLKFSCSCPSCTLSHTWHKHQVTLYWEVYGSLVVWSVTPWGCEWVTVGVSIGVST